MPPSPKASAFTGTSRFVIEGTLGEGGMGVVGGARVEQQALSMIVPVREGRERELDEWLRAERAALLSGLKGAVTVHFLRFVLLPAAAGRGGRALLAFESTFDGELEPHLNELRAAWGARLDALFAFVQGFAPTDEAGFARFVRQHSQRAQSFYAANSRISLARIREDAELAREIDSRLREVARGGTVPAEVIAAELVQRAHSFAQARGTTLGPSTAPEPLRLGWGALLGARWLAFVVAWALAPWFELRDALERRRAPTLDAAHERAARDALAAEEDWGEQNGLTHVVAVRAGAYRMFALRLVLELTSALARAAGERGKLGGVESLHGARWLILPDRRLLFLASFDGSWQALVGAFQARARRALTMLWSHTVDFPATRWLFWRGAADGPAFMAYARTHQVPNQLWFSAYPTLSVRAVRRNARIRELLGSELGAARVRELLALL